MTTSKEVAKFPDLIAKMDADLPWTMDLGQAFIDQPKELMDTIQDLRAKAKKAGNLQTSPQQIVTVTNIIRTANKYNRGGERHKEIVKVVPANPEVVYVPAIRQRSTIHHPLMCTTRWLPWSHSA